MKKLLAAGAAAGLVLLGAGIAPASAAPSAGQVCPALSSGKIDVANGVKALTVKAPYGMKISKICVKAGSAKQGDGAYTYTYKPGDYRTSVYLKHPSGKDLSHYSVQYVKTTYPEPYEPPYNGGY